MAGTPAVAPAVRLMMARSCPSTGSPFHSGWTVTPTALRGLTSLTNAVIDPAVTLPSTQCAAVSTVSGAITVPPHRLGVCSLTNCG